MTSCVRPLLCIRPSIHSARYLTRFLLCCSGLNATLGIPITSPLNVFALHCSINFIHYPVAELVHRPLRSGRIVLCFILAICEQQVPMLVLAFVILDIAAFECDFDFQFSSHLLPQNPGHAFQRRTCLTHCSRLISDKSAYPSKRSFLNNSSVLSPVRYLILCLGI